jgi:regulator of cell morphogenesis and NO signaling
MQKKNHTMITTHNKTIGGIVADDYRTAQVFKNHGIDFCCNGNRTITEACEAANLPPAVLLHELEALKQDSGPQSDYQAWPPDVLSEYIEKRHHRYVEEKIPVLKGYLEKLCRVHGNRHPELLEVARHFQECAGELTVHMKKEELVLFPFIRKMTKIEPGQSMRAPYFGSIENPIGTMMHDHDSEGERFRKIAALTDNYTAPADACGTYRVTYSLLREFEDDLHLHIHLENNILFPKAMRLEKQLRGEGSPLHE